MKRPSTRKLRSKSAETRRAAASVKTGTSQLHEARELALASGETILRRAARASKAIRTGEGLHDPEFVRMGSEKAEVLLDSWHAMGLRLPALNRLMAQHWSSQLQKMMSSAFAMGACRSPAAAAVIGYRAGASMISDAAALNLALIRFGQGVSLAAGAPVLRMAAGNARRLAFADS
jgi:hypothetical protein